MKRLRAWSFFQGTRSAAILKALVILFLRRHSSWRSVILSARRGKLFVAPDSSNLLVIIVLYKIFDLVKLMNVHPI